MPSSHRAIIFILLLVIQGCLFSKDDVKLQGINLKDNPSAPTPSPSTSPSHVSLIDVQSNQLIIQGQNLNHVSELKLTGPSSFEENFIIISKSATQIIANATQPISVAIGALFSLIISDAHGQTAYSITFTLEDGQVTANKLHHMGANDGDVLVYNQTQNEWQPLPLSGLSYRGTWDARTIGEDGNGLDPDSVPSQGDYWVVSTGGSHNLDGITNWSVGDWAIYNGIEWHKVVNTSDVVSFNGRQGAVTPQTGDYTWAQIDKSASTLGDIADIDLTGIQDGDVIKWDSGTSTWVAAPDDNDGGSGTITAVTATAPLSSTGGSTPEISITQASSSSNGFLSAADWIIFDGKQDAIADFEGDVRSTPITGFSAGAGTVAPSDTILEAFNKVVGNILAIDTTLGDHASDIAANTAAIGALSVPDDTDDLSEGSTNLYFTDARARAAAVVDSAAGTQTDQAPSVASIKAYIASEVTGLGDGDFLRDGSRSMQGNLDLDGNSILNIDHLDAATLDGDVLTIDTMVRLKDVDNDNYVELKAPQTLATDLEFILPDSYGDSGDVLATDGAGNLEWISLGGGTVSAVTAAAPLASSGGATPEISLARATASVPGYLHQDDFDTFNSKQDALPTGGTTSQYLRGDLSLSNLGDDVRITPITGFSAGAGTVAATDTIVQAFNKVVGNLTATNTAIDNLDTDDIDEGTRLYFTDARARTAAVVDSTAGTQTDQAPSVASMKAYATPQAREISAGDGLSGGGDLSANRTLDVNVDNDTIEINGSNELQVREISSTQVVNQIEVISSSAGLLPTDRNKTILASGDTTLTLPAAATAGAGYTITIKNTDPTNKITIEGDGAETIDGAEVRSLNEQYAAVQLLTDGVEWFITYSMGTMGTIGKVIDCPTGFIPVFGSSTYGTDDFCVMKYEARDVAGVPTSHETGTPWVSIWATNAKAECTEMNTDLPGTGGTFDLISNDEWMTIARDAESIGSNWSGGTPGTGHMPQGWAANTSWGDAWTNSAVAPNSESSCLYNTAANTCGASGDHKYRRTLALSTGEEIWDFAGNVWNWVDWVKGGGSLDLGPTSCTAAWTELDNVSCGALDENRDLRASNPAYNSAQGVGQFYGGSGGAARRGGRWNYGSVSGAFSLNLFNSASHSNTDIGFRCVWRP